MAELKYSDLSLKLNKDVNVIKFNDAEIEVLKYLPAEDKLDLLEVTLQKSKDMNEGYNDYKMEVYFHLNLVYLYTNLVFTEDERDDEIYIYDCIKSNGLLDAIVNAIDDEEYHYLFATLIQMAEYRTKRDTSIVALVRGLVNDLPAQVEAAAKAVEEFDPEKYQAVTDFAKSINNGVLPIKK